MSIIPNLFGDLRRNFVRMIVGMKLPEEVNFPSRVPCWNWRTVS